MSAAVSGLFIRPPRSKYDIKSLGPRLQKLASWKGYPIVVRREDFQLRNRRNLNLACSIYFPVRKDYSQLCILYCHGASGGRLDGITDVWEIAMQLEAALCVFDFGGCGKSQGDYITLGMWEEDDVRCLVEELVEVHDYENIVLWGRSMGAVSCVRAASHDPMEWVPPPPPLKDQEYMMWQQRELVSLLIDLEEEERECAQGKVKSPPDADSDNIPNNESEMKEASPSSPPASPVSAAPSIARMPRTGTSTCAAPRISQLGRTDKKELIRRIQNLTKKQRERERRENRVGFMSAVKCLVLDSPFGNLWSASKHIVEHYKSVVPQFMLRGLASVGLPIVRKSILKQVPEFDIKKLECISGASRCQVPAIILHAKADSLIPWEESRKVYNAYGTATVKRRPEVPKGLALSSSPNRVKSSTTSSQQTSPMAKQDKEKENDESYLAKTPTKGTADHKGNLSFRMSNRRATSPADPPPALLHSPGKKMASEDSGSGVPKQYVIIDGDHNSLRPASYYDAIASFLGAHAQGIKQTSSGGESAEENQIPGVVPSKLKSIGEMDFYYGVSVISEFTDEEVKFKQAKTSNVAKDRQVKPSEPTINQSSKKYANTPFEEENEDSKPKIEISASGVSCTVKTVSFSWRMVIGVHTKKGILVFRPYSGITLYAINFAELLSFTLASPAQLRFTFLDDEKTQRRVRFYSPEVPMLKDKIDRSIRKLVTHDHMSTFELMQKINTNLASASSALVEKRLLSSRGLEAEQVISQRMLYSFDRRKLSCCACR